MTSTVTTENMVTTGNLVTLALDTNELKQNNTLMGNSVHTENDSQTHCDGIAVDTENDRTTTDIIKKKPSTPDIDRDESVDQNATENSEQANKLQTSTADTTESPVYTENTTANASDNNVNYVPTEKIDKTGNHVTTENIHDTTDWGKLMINSDDSLFEEMTMQVDNKLQSTNTSKMLITSPELEEEQTETNEKLPDLVQNKKMRLRDY